MPCCLAVWCCNRYWRWPPEGFATIKGITGGQWRMGMRMGKAKMAKLAKEAKEVKEAIEGKEVRISNVTFPPKFSTKIVHQIVTSLPPYS